MKKLLLLCLLPVIACSQNSKERKQFTEIPENTIINLYDAFGEDNGLQKDFGFSCILKYQGKTVLFDGGSNADVFKKNVEQQNIDLSQVDIVIASHAHFDHINGLDYLLEVNPDVKIYFPFDPFWGSNFPFNLTGQEAGVSDSLEKRMQYFDGNFDSYSFNQTGRFWKSNIEFVQTNQEIMPGIKLIASKSPFMGYFSKYPSLGVPDEQADAASQANLTQLNELSLSLATEKGEALIVGCSHSSVERIISDAKAYTQTDIALVYGGYHLLPYDRTQLTQLASRLKNDLQVKRVAPAHCTGHLAFKILQDTFGEDYVFAGLGSKAAF